MLSSIASTTLSKHDFNSYKQQLTLKYNTIINSTSTHTWGFSLHKSLSNNISIHELNNYKKTLESLTIKNLQNFLKAYFKEPKKNTVQVINQQP